MKERRTLRAVIDTHLLQDVADGTRSVKEAARSAGVHPATLKFRMKRLGYVPHEKYAVTCPLCGKSLATLAGRHIQKHGLTTRQFKQLYPTHPVVSKNCSDILSSEMKIRSIRLWNDPSTRDMMLSALKDRDVELGHRGGKICYYESRSGEVHRLRSKLELAACWLLDLEGIEYLYEPRWFIYGGVRYLLDLFICDFEVYIEVKPRRRLLEAIKKIEAVRPVLDHDIVVWDEKDLAEGLRRIPAYFDHENVKFAS